MTENNGSRLAELFTRVGRELAAQHSIEEVLAMITARALEVIPAAEHAAISRGHDGAFETVAPTSDLPLQVDQIQYDLGSGPCVDAILDNTCFRVGDLATDPSWPEFGPQAAADYGIRSMLSVRLFVEAEGQLTGLNLYAGAVDAFDDSDETTAVLLATHGALAVTAGRRQDKIDNLERALLSSRRIGIAIGILMATHKITADQAFDLLRIVSQNKHRKLVDVAESVVETGAIELPRVPETRGRR
ncbi:ANTAR domain-containing protein [uncultured Jatrophihabitans sp.]|uniref:ANTAR domain-containing protein n=1 Tax=uncultured Jatrophihabitans sp. TaxID=1610747 RepID=UPI0035CC3631